MADFSAIDLSGKQEQDGICAHLLRFGAHSRAAHGVALQTPSADYADRKGRNNHMKGWGWLIFLLILVLILVVYFRGSSSVGGTLFSGLDRSILYLQGRNSAGDFANYPTE
jgi:hypothetical protein